VSADHTDELTDYEFEYEFLQEVAHKRILADFVNNSPISMSDNGFDRQLSMDQDVYDHILEIAEAGEYFDFNIPKDADMGKSISGSNQYINNISDSEDFVPVDMAQEFGGE
jgi:hypothetical protein